MKQDDVIDFDSDMAEELARFEATERKRLGLDEKSEQWTDPLPSTFTKAQRAHTTLLVAGLTMAHDLFIQHSLRGIGYKVKALDVPDIAALQFGREFGNRGQCNPTYFTVGNLIKYLHELEEQGMSREDIIENHVFVTAGACGPCRFGTYVTEYRKALRDSGFDGFRVLLFQQTGGLKQATGDEIGLELNPTFFWAIIKSIMIGDVLNALSYRIRPYEVEEGATDRAVAECKVVIGQALESKKGLLPALYKARKLLGAVKVDRTRVAPKVGIIGEFWAMTTEGDGNYGMQRFLEGEGAEVDIQLVTAWVLFTIWEVSHDTEERANLRGADSESDGIKDVDVRKLLVSLVAAEHLVRTMFQSFAHAMGLYGYHLPDMDELAKVSHAFYDNNLRGGEGHMEVGKLILNVAKSKVNMTLSVKPFGCMPSSSVSDGIQSMITEMYPEGIFLPIETNGDGSVNAYSRVQMQLFKAKQAAQREVDAALAEAGMTMDEVRKYIEEHPAFSKAFHRSGHRYGCTAADLVREVGRRKHRAKALRETLTLGIRRAMGKGDEQTLATLAKIAAAKAAQAAKQSATKTTTHIPGAMSAGKKEKATLRVLN